MVAVRSRHTNRSTSSSANGRAARTPLRRLRCGGERCEAGDGRTFPGPHHRPSRWRARGGCVARVGRQPNSDSRSSNRAWRFSRGAKVGQPVAARARARRARRGCEGVGWQEVNRKRERELFSLCFAFLSIQTCSASTARQDDKGRNNLMLHPPQPWPSERRSARNRSFCASGRGASVCPPWPASRTRSRAG